MLDNLVRNWCTKSFVSFVVCCFLISHLNLAKAKDLGRISGKILDPQGVPVAGAHLKLVNAGGNLIRESTGDSQGNFTLDGVDPGEYQLRGESDSFVSVIVNVSLAGRRVHMLPR